MPCRTKRPPPQKAPRAEFTQPAGLRRPGRQRLSSTIFEGDRPAVRPYASQQAAVLRSAIRFSNQPTQCPHTIRQTSAGLSPQRSHTRRNTMKIFAPIKNSKGSKEMSSREIVKHHTAVTLAAAALVAAASVAFAAPAQATTQSPCTVTPLKPSPKYNINTDKWTADYRVVVSCWQSRTVRIEQKRYEEDWDSLWPISTNADDYLGSTTFVRYIPANTSVTLHNVRTVVNTESGAEEIYQKVRFRSAVSGGLPTDWTKWERTRLRHGECLDVVCTSDPRSRGVSCHRPITR